MGELTADEASQEQIMALIVKDDGKDAGEWLTQTAGATGKARLGRASCARTGCCWRWSPSWCFFSVMVRATQGVDFLSAQNITNLFLQNSYVIIMALGMLLVIVAGHIDLSVGSVAAFTGAVAAWLTVRSGLAGLGRDPADAARGRR